MDFNERVIPGVTSNFLYQEALSRYEFALHYIKNGDKVLEIGCGTGYGSQRLSSKADVVGIDINKEAILYSKKYFANNRINYKVLNATDIKWINHFDVIVAFETIEHLSKIDLALRKIKKALKKDGVFILSTPNKAITLSEEGYISPYHIREYSFGELTKLVKKYFRNADFFYQTKSAKAIFALKKFMGSQYIRQKIVDRDKLGFRKLISRETKEKLWKVLGAMFGRKVQESLTVQDFPIRQKVRKTYYFVVICKK